MIITNYKNESLKQNSNYRNIIIDNLRGVAFILMIVHHIFYIYDITNNDTLHQNQYITLCGSIARNLFIFLVGFSLVYCYNNNPNNFVYKKIKQSIIILLHAFMITLITYYFYPEKYIRFGVLHFIGTVTLLMILIVPFKNYYILFLLISLGLQFINYPYFYNIFDIILGQNPPYYNMMDWFPLLHWIPIILLGMISANYFNLDQLNISKIKTFGLQFNILTWIGQNCLNLYTIHFYILVIVNNLIKYYNK